MSTVDEGLEAQIRNIEEKYGKPLSEWIAIVRNSGLTKHTEIVAMLKSQYGMSHGSEHRVALKARSPRSFSGRGVRNKRSVSSPLVGGKIGRASSVSR
jgi:hypothetical protein